MNLLEKTGQSIRARKLFARGQPLLVAVSGGVDSVALLHLLHALAPKHGWRLTVAHFNHQLRGSSSDADERLVARTARELGLPFVSGRADVPRFSRAEKISIEMAGRRLRHDFLARTAKRLRIPTVALAHHANDQVELFFLRLLRGGGEGLAGMKWQGPSPGDARVRLARPLLDVGKAELEKFARENQIKFREDASNASLDFQRNRIRHELLPLLRRKYSPALERVVLRTMDIIGAESEFVAAACRKYHHTKNDFQRLPVAVQRRLMQQQLLERGVAPEFELIERLRGEANCAVTIGSRKRVWRDAAGVVRVGESSVARGTPCAPSAEVDLRRSGVVVFAGTKFAWKIERQARFARPKPVTGRELFDAGVVGSRIVLRHWRAGDRFQPIGMKAAVKLQDLFVNAKIPRPRRRELVVGATVGGEIFWVEGLRMGERFKLGAGTKRRLRWEWKKAA